MIIIKVGLIIIIRVSLIIIIKVCFTIIMRIDLIIIRRLCLIIVLRICIIIIMRICMNSICSDVRPANIYDRHIHSKLCESVVSYNVTKCDRRRYSHFQLFASLTVFTSATTSCVL